VFWLLVLVAVIIAFMVGAGLLGGAVNHYYADEDKKAGAMTLKQCMAAGVAASFIVPVFLLLIKNDLISTILTSDKAADKVSGIFLLIGFCLIAAISSKKFINSVADLALKRADEANKVAAGADQTAKDAGKAAATADKKAAAASKAAAGAESAALAAGQRAKDALGFLDEGDHVKSIKVVLKDADARGIRAESKQDKTLLGQMADSSFALRSLSGLVVQSKRTEADVKSALATLVEQGLVAQRTLEDGAARWYVTTAGRVSLGK
jgi:hypothetical protein